MIPVASFDLETTGVDVETARIVSAALVILGESGEVTAWREWRINPGVLIPAEATAVHGITDADAAEGLDPAAALEDMFACLLFPLGHGSPLVVYNAPYDLTLFDREWRRHMAGSPTLFDDVIVLDPLVLDKATDKFRKGSRKLVDTAKHYGVEFDGEAHGALADATAAGRLAQIMLTRPELVNYGPAAIHAAQIDWSQSQAENYARYLRGQGKDASGVSGEWPMRAWKDAPDAQ